MRIALVGNGPVSRHYATEIDAHDFVVRFNTCHHYGLSGYKVDALVLVNINSVGWRFAFEDNAIHHDALKNAKEIWLLRPAAEIHIVPNDPKPGDYTDDLIRNRLGSKPFVRPTPEVYFSAMRTLQNFGAAPGLVPSSGFLALFYLRHIVAEPNVTLYGFTHKGSSVHPWAAERAYVQANRSWIRSRKRNSVLLAAKGYIRETISYLRSAHA